MSKKEYKSGFRFTSECFANKTTFHYIVNIFTNHASPAVNNDIGSDVKMRHSLYRLNYLRVISFTGNLYLCL